jgi:acylaminoacyl-peptidase
MYEKSPIFHAGKIVAPFFLMIGKNDLRVPPSQGRELFNFLKADGKEVYMNVYDDCHPLSKPPVHSDVFVNTALFFSSVLNPESS